MKVEPRGKYPGVKIHLDKEQSERLLDGRLALGVHIKELELKPSPVMLNLMPRLLDVLALLKEMGKAVKKLHEENPRLLEERTEEEIVKELQIEREKSDKKLAQIAAGEDWRTK